MQHSYDAYENFAILISSTNKAMKLFSVADRMCRSCAIDLICVDSVSALTPRAEIEVCALFSFCPFSLLKVNYISIPVVY